MLVFQIHRLVCLNVHFLQLRRWCVCVWGGYEVMWCWVRPARCWVSSEWTNDMQILWIRLVRPSGKELRENVCSGGSQLDWTLSVSLANSNQFLLLPVLQSSRCFVFGLTLVTGCFFNDLLWWSKKEILGHQQTNSDWLNILSVLFTADQTNYCFVFFLRLNGITAAFRLPFAFTEQHPNSHYPALLLSVSHWWN